MQLAKSKNLTENGPKIQPEWAQFGEFRGQFASNGASNGLKLASNDSKLFLKLASKTAKKNSSGAARPT